MLLILPLRQEVVFLYVSFRPGEYFPVPLHLFSVMLISNRVVTNKPA